ncbi:PRC-barrel domain-containing protein [Paraburkholderia sp. CNPSo 3272]|uniref:PRC-barrel domain-containing protein n=1 Tax=Paraburkholderia sp. CNPSo 3272 TaxID=2940931 RepID=UPI0020B69B0F|nr:PRC-barrel domain-containing protein [Paraburkholderia sp. CNPSo 3272]MCP3722650.1 PRC-barrel domain-containing protein [Paraburkholderia sp. CNPSo 3272]
MALDKAVLAAVALAACIDVHAQFAGTQPLSVTIEQSQALLRGWSVKKSVLGKSVYNDQSEKIGAIKDLIVAPDGSVSAAIVAAGGFLGVATHDVAVPIAALDVRGGNLYLPGATWDAIMATPEFQYAKVQSPPRPKKVPLCTFNTQPPRCSDEGIAE